MVGRFSVLRDFDGSLGWLPNQMGSSVLTRTEKADQLGRFHSVLPFTNVCDEFSSQSSLAILKEPTNLK